MLMLVLFGTVLVLWLWSKRNRNKDEPPVGSGSRLLLGHAVQYVGNSIKLWDTITSFSKEALERGGAIKTTFGPRVYYFLSDPADFLTLSNACLHKDPLYSFAEPWLGDGLVTAAPSKWKIHRKVLNPAFSQHVLDSFMDVFNKQSRCLVRNMEVEVGQGPFDQWAYTKQNALETICSTALGMNFEEKKVVKSEYFKAITNIFQIFTIRFQNVLLHNNLLFNLTSWKRKQDGFIKVLHKMSDKILKRKKEEFIKKLSEVEERRRGHIFKPFMELLLELSQDTDVFTDRVIREHIDTIIVTGHDTSATAVMFCTLLVGSHPRVQQKIYEELNNIFGDNDRDVTKQDLSQLVYLEAVIKETLRIYPVVPIIARQLHEDIKLGNCTLSKGKSVIMSIYGVYRHSMWGPDVEEFRPERWLDPAAVTCGPFGLTAFGVGRRFCLGKTYAMMSMKVTLAHIYRSYVVHSDHTQLKLKLDVMLKPVSGYYITIAKRNKTLLDD